VRLLYLTFLAIESDAYDPDEVEKNARHEYIESDSRVVKILMAEGRSGPCNPKEHKSGDQDYYIT